MPALFLILFFSSAFADRFEVQNLIQKTFTHDNTFCNLEGTRVEFELRSLSKFTEPKEKQYGEFAFYRPRKLLKLLPLNKDSLHSYRFFPGANSLCSKSLGYKLSPETSAILFLRENNPYKGKLAIQLFDHKKLEPKEVVETEYSTDEVLPSQDGFKFKVVPERHDILMGKIKIQDVDYTYQDRDFHLWMNYSVRGFEPLPSFTFEKFAWKEFFKDEADFNQTLGFNPATKTFSNIYLYIAVNHQVKKQCLLTSSTMIKVTGTESWRCR